MVSWIASRDSVCNCLSKCHTDDIDDANCEKKKVRLLN